MTRSIKMRAMITITLVLAATFLGLGPSMGLAQADKHTLTCGPEKTIGQAIKTLKPGDTLLVSGTCNENIDLGEEVHGITLEVDPAIFMGWGRTSEPGRMRCRPFTTTRSPGLRPAFTMRSPCAVAPSDTSR